MISTLRSDLRAAAGSIRRQPAFSAVVIATLAIGIAGNTAVFSLVYDALLRPMPYADPERLVMARRTVSGAVQALNSTPDFLDYREQASSFEALTATQGIALRATVLGPAERVKVTRVSGDFFAVLGVAPVAGRRFLESDGGADAPLAVVVGEDLARRRFGSAAAAIGRPLAVSGAARSDISPTIVGVMPAGFRFMAESDVWLPMRKGENDGPQTRNQHRWVLVGRLKKGATIQSAQREVDGIARRLQAQYPQSNANKGLRLDPLQDVLVTSRRPRLIVLSAAVALTLLIACANVAGLLLARGAGRRQELAIRAALGATRSKLAAQLLAESQMLAGIAAVAGTAAGLWLQRFLVTVADVGNQAGARPGISAAVLLFALGLALATGLLFGLAPALLVSMAGPGSALSQGVRATASRGPLRHALVTAQVALSLTLLVAAGLLIRSFVGLTTTPLGFDPQQVVTATVDLPRMALDERVRLLQGLRDEVAGMPGVAAVSAVSHVPMRDPFDDLPAWVTGRRPADASGERSAHIRLCASAYFRTMGIPLLAGRDLADSDRAATARVAVINQAMALEFFPGEDPVGRHVTVTSRPAPVDFEIVGVVGDARIDGVAMAAPTTMYVPMDQFWETRTEMSLVVRTMLAPEAISTAVARMLTARNPNVPAGRFVSMGAVIGDTLRLQRATTLLLGLLSAAGLLLAALGLYGVLSHHVAERTRELGIRMALGASPRALIGSVLGRGLAMVLPGLALGLAASRGANQILARLLRDVPPADPLAYATGALVLAAAAILASARPAHRAASVDPVRTLRGD